jgi:hypothetical protein
MKSFAIVIVCYKRLDGIKRLLQGLEAVDYAGRKDITLVFSIDNSGESIVEEYAKNYQWEYGEKIVRTFPERQGLKSHILQCGEYTKQFDIVAVLEDDIFVSDSFYYYAYNAAEFYELDDRVAGISLYSFQKNWLDWTLRFEPQKNEYDTYFMKIAQSWGQIWMKDKWEHFVEWYQKNSDFSYTDKIPEYLNTWPKSSWLKYHTRYCIETDRYFVYPYVSLSTNFSDAGEHTDVTINDHQVDLVFGKKNYSFSPLNEDSIIYDEYCNRCNLAKYLNIPDNELTVDFWGTKRRNLDKRYVLTTASLKYKVISSYALSLRPIEMPVILGQKGHGIYLYDTNEPGDGGKDGAYNLLLYSIRSHDFRRLLPFAIKLTRKELFRSLHRKLKKIKNKIRG